MATMQDLIDKLDDELHSIAVPPSEASGETAERFGNLCVIKNTLAKIPLTDEQVNMLAYMPKPLESIEAVWRDPSRDNQTIAEAVADYLIEAAPQYRRGLLFDKMSNELDRYLADAMSSLAKTGEISTADFVSVSYEVTLKQEILMLFDNDDAINDRMIEILLATKQPLDGIYQEWLGNDLSVEDVLLEMLDSFIYNSEKDLRSQYEYGGKLPDYIVERFERTAQTGPDDEVSEDLEP